jgi:hypothetical protein
MLTLAVFLLGAPLKGPAIQALWAHRPHDPPVPKHVAAAQDGAPEQLSVASDVDFHAIDHMFDLHKKSERSSEAPETVSTPSPGAPAAAAAEPWLTPQLLQLWSDSLGRGAVSGTSPLVGDAVVDAIKPMASQLEAMPGLVERLLPVLLHVLQVSATECD